jgi:hypothetical protein
MLTSQIFDLEMLHKKKENALKSLYFLFSNAPAVAFAQKSSSLSTLQIKLWCWHST